MADNSSMSTPPSAPSKAPTREQATMSANGRRMNRNETRMASGKGDLEFLKKIPRGKAANETWRPAKKKGRSSGR